MPKVTVWKEPAWGTAWARFEARWSVDDGYRTTSADSWQHAMTIARSWAGVK